MILVDTSVWIDHLRRGSSRLRFLETNDLSGSGIGWVDAHLLASASLARTPIWTLDRRMAALARALDLAFA